MPLINPTHSWATCWWESSRARERKRAISRVAKLTTFGGIDCGGLPCRPFFLKELLLLGSVSLVLSLLLSLCAPHLPLHCVKLIKVVGWLGVAAAAFFRCCKRVFLLVRPPLRHPPGQVGHHPLARNSFAFMLLGFSCFLLFRMPLACYSLFVIVLVVAPLLLIAVHSEKSP